MNARNNANWLDRIYPWNIYYEKLPVERLLAQARLCPTPEYDRNTAAFLVERVHSFIHADRRCTASNLDPLMERWQRNHYHVVARRAVAEREVALGTRAMVCAADWFCQWIILQRCERRVATREPERISVLYVQTEAASLYRMLYAERRPASNGVADETADYRVPVLMAERGSFNYATHSGSRFVGRAVGAGASRYDKANTPIYLT